MYRVEIMGPAGRRILEWDPEKLQQRDPNTMKTVHEADKLLKEAVATIRAGEASTPKMAVSGRWSPKAWI